MRKTAQHPLKSLCLFAVFTIVPAFALSAQAQSGSGSAQVQDDSPPAASTAVPEPRLQSGALPARLSDVEGPVHITAASQPIAAAQASTTPGRIPPPPPDQVPTDGKLNMPVPVGTGLQTGDKGRAELQFDDGSIARIAPGSAAVLTELNSRGEQMTSLAGLSYFETAAQSSGNLSVRVGAYTIKPDADTLVRVDMDKSPDTVAVLRGLASVASDDADFTLHSGQTATLGAADAGGHKVSAEVASNSWDAWNADRDAQLSEMASGQTNARDGGSNADAGAWDDLDYYGTWYDVPGAGEAWAPDGVDADFDPYGDGAWTYYTGTGYVWVSAYPWGWLPYHCGIWSYYNNFGWLWEPGACGTYDGGGWFPYTAVFHPPHGYRLPRHRPIHPFDPRLRTHLGGVPMPPIQAYQSVQRGPHFQFRALGGARPDPRPLPVQSQTSDNGGIVYASTLPIVPVLPTERGQYRSGIGGDSGGGASGSGFTEGAGRPGSTDSGSKPGSNLPGFGIHDQHVRGVYIPRTVVTPLGAETGRPAERGNEPAPRSYEPRMAPAPRMEAPRSAPAPHYSPPAPHYSAPAPSYSAPSPRSAPSSHGH
jgi:hypothetical protein